MTVGERIDALVWPLNKRDAEVTRAVIMACLEAVRDQAAEIAWDDADENGASGICDAIARIDILAIEVLPPAAVEMAESLPEPELDEFGNEVP